MRRAASAHDAASKACQSRDVAVREHVLEVVGERPEPPLLDQLDRRRRHDLVLVVDELRERVLEVARRGS